MGLFENWPYTNYHDLNTDWIASQVGVMKDAVDSVTESVQTATAAATLATNQANQALSAATNAKGYRDTAKEYRDEVQLFADSLPFVTPEQYGAVGNGMTDDTQAWQDAVDSGYNVKASSKAYRCGQIDVTKNISIDCNGARFLCDDNILFNCTGTVVTILASEPDYDANTINYSITNYDYTTYTGMAMLKGTNNFEKARTDYLGGFTCEFYNGKLTSAYPIDVTGVSIEIITPIKVKISNVGNIKHISTSTSNIGINILYGFGCVISNALMPDTNAYDVINIQNSMSCIIDNVNIKQLFTSGTNNSYLVSINSSSHNTISNCEMFNEKWHCISTGGSYCCYHNVVENCNLSSDSQVAYYDHENAVNTNIINSVLTSAGLSAMGVIRDCVIISNKLTTKYCEIQFTASSNNKIAVYTAENIKMYPETGVNSSYVGVYLHGSPYTSGESYYFQDVVLKNVKCLGSDNARFGYALATGSTYYLRDILIDDSNLLVHGTNTSWTHVDITSYNLKLVNFNTRLAGGTTYPTIYGNNEQYTNVYITNCNLNGMLGKYANLYLNDVTIPTAIANINVIGNLFGSLVNFKIMPAVLLGATYVKITDMKDGNIDSWLNIGTGNDANVYYQHYVSGTMTTVQVTP